MLRIKDRLPLIAILLLATALRFYALGNYPINVDEAAKGYNAYSLLKTGKTFRGLSWPLYFNDYSDKQPSHAILYNYMVVPAVAIFGLNEVAVRLPAAVSGVATVFIIYFLALELFKKKDVAIYSALFLAISPWHVYMSRVGIEPVTYPLVFLSGVLFAYKALHKPGFLALSAVLFGICLYTYQSALLTVPFFLCYFLLSRAGFWLRRWIYVFLAALLFVFVIAPTAALFLFDPLMLGHFYNSSGPAGFGLSQFVLSYLGQLLTLPTLVPLPVLFLSLLGLVKSARSEHRGPVLSLIAIGLVSIVPAAATYIQYAVTISRSIPITGVIEMVAALGLSVLVTARFVGRITFTYVFTSSLALSGMLLLALYESPPFYFARGFKEAVSFIKLNEAEYDTVLVKAPSNQPFIYFLFYGEYPPEKFLKTEVRRYYYLNQEFPYEYVYSYDKYVFCPASNCSASGRVLYLLGSKEAEDPRYREVKPVFFGGEKVLSIAEDAEVPASSPPCCRK